MEPVMLFLLFTFCSLIMAATAGPLDSPKRTLDIADAISSANSAKAKLHAAGLPGIEQQVDELIKAFQAISPEDRAMLNNPNRAADNRLVDITLEANNILKNMHEGFTKGNRDEITASGAQLIFSKNNLEAYLNANKTAGSGQKPAGSKKEPCDE